MSTVIGSKYNKARIVSRQPPPGWLSPAGSPIRDITALLSELIFTETSFEGRNIKDE